MSLNAYDLPIWPDRYENVDRPVRFGDIVEGTDRYCSNDDISYTGKLFAFDVEFSESADGTARPTDWWFWVEDEEGNDYEVNEVLNLVKTKDEAEEDDEK